MATTYLQNTTTTATDTKKFTWSMWVKRSLLGSPAQRIWNIYADTNNKAQVAFNTDDQFSYFDKLGGSEVWSQTPKMKLRDTSAWYHIVVAVDTTQGTEANRAKIYINGELQTELEAGGSYPSINASTGTQITTSSNNRRIGSNESANTHFDGLISHLHFVDGTAYAPTSFGEVDSTSGIWKAKSSASVTYGNNGFFLKMENSGAMGTDSSGKGNNFTVSGSLTQNVDTPSNNFATWNNLNYVQANNSPVFSNGNTKMNGTHDAPYPNAISTLGIPKSGKYYAEFKNAGTQSFAIGICDISKGMEALRTASTSIYNTSFNGAVSLKNDGSVIRNGTETNSVTPTIAQNDIVMIAYDADNGAFYAGRNGTWGTVGGVVGVPTSGSSKTGAIDISAQSWFTTSTDQGFLVGSTSSGGYAIVEANFGNGYFGTTAVSSAGTNASGNGIFEYDVPTGYTAISTKGLNS